MSTIAAGVTAFPFADYRRLCLSRGDITSAHSDAIVNAANESLLGGGGVDGAIHRAAGPSLLKACKAIPEVQPGVRCPPGEARSTPAFGLDAQIVIHTVGPRFESDAVSSPVLRDAYFASLATAEKLGMRSVAFPAISTGAFGYPLDDAAQVAVAAVINFDDYDKLRDVRFVLFDAPAFAAFHQAASRLLGNPVS